VARISPKKPARKGAGKKTGQRLGLFALFLFVQRLWSLACISWFSIQTHLRKSRRRN